MLTKNPKLKLILEKYQEISLLEKINALLDWDLNVYMPEKGSLGRAKQRAYLTEKLTNIWLDESFKNLILDLEQNQKSLNKTELAILRNLLYKGKYFFKVPKEIIIKKEKVVSEAFVVWQNSKKNNKFVDFLPFLKEIINLNQIIADHLGYQENPYDALLDLYEQNLNSKMCNKMFSNLQPFLTDTLKKIQESKNYQTTSSLINGDLNYSSESQKNLAFFVMQKMGFNMDAGRLDESAHPFTTTLVSKDDVRITTWIHPKDFRDSLTSTMHEAGHGLYEQNISEEFSETPLEFGVSLGIHECMSRFWENMVGRNPHFLEFLTPHLKEFFPEQLKKVSSQEIIQVLNMVKPSLIRVEADEVTYNLHIILRFEIENDLINKKIKAADVPEVWRDKMKKYLGIMPKTDREGCLQDVHWTYGNFGYFPAYCLGNLYGAQLLNQMKKTIKIEKALLKGELGTILYWLNENIHQYGSLYWPHELIKKATGEDLNPEYYKNYIKEKYLNKVY